MGKRGFSKYTFVFLFIVLCSCSTSKFVVDVTKPPSIEIPVDIGRILIANRCLKEEFEKPDEVVKGLIAGEGPVINQAGAKKAVESVIDDIRYAPGMEPVYTSAVPRVDTLDKKFPQSLDWIIVENLCRQYNSDALLSLEVFNTNTYIDYGYYQRRETKDHVKIWSNTKVYNKNIDHIPLARLRVEITAGWRIYYPADKQIVVEELKKHTQLWEFEGKTQKEAMRNLPSKMFAVEEAGKLAGIDFSSRLYPKRTTVERVLFIKGSRDFKIANQHLKQRHWKSAATIWKKYTNDPDNKIASAALFNLAVINEMEGNIEEAFRLAKQAGGINEAPVIKEYVLLLEEKAKQFRK
ncbi:MAG: hypothetical protein KAT40_00315 [Bacteroidales bacterium]|nr:hypothetical protein [Bacteroidales bacterium]